MVTKEKCEWCDIAKEKGIKCDPKDCDFKSIPLTTVGVLKRMQEESDAVYDLKMRVIKERLTNEKTREIVTSVFDKVKGLDVMMYVLNTRFGMDNDHVFSKLDRKKLTSMQSTQFAIKVLEATRGGKNDDQHTKRNKVH